MASAHESAAVVRRVDLRGDAYVLVEHPQPHPERARQILRDHPDVRRLFGPSWVSAALIVGLVGLQLTLAVALMGQPWWVMLLAAFFFGAYVDHALWVLVHECAHGLVFRSPTANRVMAIVANLAFVIPSTVQFSIYHLKHHTFLGHVHHDADVAPRWEAWLLRGGFARRLLWMALYPFTQGLRSIGQPRGHEPKSWTRWVWPNIIAVVLFDIAFFAYLGPGCFRYLLLSVFFSIGPHPLGARWIQEHSVFREGQETYSYYGPLNVLSLNIGYHNEHHDLPTVAWHRLPKLRALAPEMYDQLYYHRSMTGLWLRFIFDRELQVYRLARLDQHNRRPDKLERLARKAGPPAPHLPPAGVRAESVDRRI